MKPETFNQLDMVWDTIQTISWLVPREKKEQELFNWGYTPPHHLEDWEVNFIFSKYQFVDKMELYDIGIKDVDEYLTYINEL